MFEPVSRSVVVRRALISATAGVVALAALAPAAQAHELFVASAAVDQPRINVAFARPTSPDSPLIGEGIDPNDPLGATIQTIQVQGYFDTGASGIVIAESTADALGITRSQHNGQDVIFGDVAPGGIVEFYVSEPLVVKIAPSLGFYDNEQPYADRYSDPANFGWAYEPTQLTASNPARIQIGPVGGGGGAAGDLNVIGVPAMQNKVVVFDSRPTNNFITLFDEDPNNDNYDSFMRSYVYEAGDNYNRGPATLDDPGIPQTDVTVPLTYADFSRFTTTTPAGAPGPTATANPFIGPDPLAALNGTVDSSPGVRIGLGNNVSEGSWLLDTGAAASFISESVAGDLGVSYDPANPIGSENPRLLGVSEDRQFTLAISGISGEAMNIAGFYADDLTVPTAKADPNHPQDEENLHYNGAPVLVFDITVEDPETGQTLTLDGIFGMNYLTASADFLFDGFFPTILAAEATPFDWVVFDEPAGELRLALAEGSFNRDVLPEPSAALGVAGLMLLGLRRRRA